MRTKSIISVFCMAILLPGVATAKNSGCTVLPVGDQAFTGEPLIVKVVTGFPGGWFKPTITGTAVFPMPKRNEFAETVTVTIDTTNVNNVKLPFSVPDETTGIKTVMDNGNSTIKIDVTVSEPRSNGAEKKSVCSARVDVLPGM